MLYSYVYCVLRSKTGISESVISCKVKVKSEVKRGFSSNEKTVLSVNASYFAYCTQIRGYEYSNFDF